MKPISKSFGIVRTQGSLPRPRKWLCTQVLLMILEDMAPCLRPHWSLKQAATTRLCLLFCFLSILHYNQTDANDVAWAPKLKYASNLGYLLSHVSTGNNVFVVPLFNAAYKLFLINMWVLPTVKCARQYSYVITIPRNLHHVCVQGLLPASLWQMGLHAGGNRRR
jgi:hypothetical protein